DLGVAVEVEDGAGRNRGRPGDRVIPGGHSHDARAREGGGVGERGAGIEGENRAGRGADGSAALVIDGDVDVLDAGAGAGDGAARLDDDTPDVNGVDPIETEIVGAGEVDGAAVAGDEAGARADADVVP